MYYTLTQVSSDIASQQSQDPGVCVCICLASAMWRSSCVSVCVVTCVCVCVRANACSSCVCSCLFVLIQTCVASAISRSRCVCVCLCVWVCVFYGVCFFSQLGHMSKVKICLYLEPQYPTKKPKNFCREPQSSKTRSINVTQEKDDLKKHGSMRDMHWRTTNPSWRETTNPIRTRDTNPGWNEIVFLVQQDEKHWSDGPARTNNTNPPKSETKENACSVPFDDADFTLHLQTGAHVDQLLFLASAISRSNTSSLKVLLRLLRLY